MRYFGLPMNEAAEIVHLLTRRTFICLWRPSNSELP